MTKIKDEFVKLTNKQLEQKYNFIQNYKQANNAAEGSNVDANSNVATKNIATLMAELNKDINIQIKRYCVSKKIEELFLEITDGIHLQNHQTKNILKTLSLLKRDENFFLEKSSEGVLKSIVEQKNMR